VSRSSRLGAAVERSGRRGRGRRFPEALRKQLQAEAVARRGRGESIALIARVLRVSEQSIRRWCGDGGTGSPKLVPVVVRAEPVPSARVDVVSPTGWRIEGLDLDAALRVVRSLG